MRTTIVLVLLVAITPGIVTAAPPDAPRNLMATVTDRTAVLAWEAPLTGGLPLGYLVVAALGSGGMPVASFLVVQPTITLRGIPDGVFYVRVQAGNAEGLSTPSAEAILRVPAVPPCSAPACVPANLAAEIVGRVVTLTWTATPEICAATAFIVQAGSAAGTSNLAQFNTGQARSLTVVAPDGTYFVRVIAVGDSGVSPPSNELRVVVPGPAADLSGRWQGASDYINAPFEMDLVQRGSTITGAYQDRKDYGSVWGYITGTFVLLDVRFGDTGMRFEGNVEAADLVRGILRVPVLGTRRFTVELRR